MGAVAAIAGFILEHSELIELLFEAITKGASKDSLKKAIKAEMVAASDALMHAELGG